MLWFSLCMSSRSVKSQRKHLRSLNDLVSSQHRYISWTRSTLRLTSEMSPLLPITSKTEQRMPSSSLFLSGQLLLCRNRSSPNPTSVTVTTCSNSAIVLLEYTRQQMQHGVRLRLVFVEKSCSPRLRHLNRQPCIDGRSSSPYRDIDSQLTCFLHLFQFSNCILMYITYFLNEVG